MCLSPSRECENMLGLVRPSKPVSFGLLSKGGSLSLVLPGWGLVSDVGGAHPPVDPAPNNELSVLNTLSGQ